MMKIIDDSLSVLTQERNPVVFWATGVRASSRVVEPIGDDPEGREVGILPFGLEALKSARPDAPCYTAPLEGAARNRVDLWTLRSES